jgi:transposase
MTKHHVYGVDVGKKELVIACAGESGVIAIRNCPKAIAAWLKTLPPASTVGMESTSRYHEALASAAHAAGHRVFVLNPKDVHHYAKGIGQRGKTDPVDARLIARYLDKEADRLHPWVPPSPFERALLDLLRQRGKLVDTRTALRQSLGQHGKRMPEMQRLLKSLEAAIAALEKQIRQALRDDLARGPLAARLRTIPGIGHQVGAWLALYIRRLPFARVASWIAYTGLDPRPADSGRKRGKRRITKRGPGDLRQALHMAAMAFSRSKLGKPMYQRLKDRLSTTEAYVVIARQLARLAWAIHISDAPFDPDRFQREHPLVYAQA